MGFWVRLVLDPATNRHYCESPVARTQIRPIPDPQGIQANFVEEAGPALCGRHLHSGLWVDAADNERLGGLSAVQRVNLLSDHLCAKCLRAYLKTRPHLAGPVEAARNLRIDSE